MKEMGGSRYHREVDVLVVMRMELFHDRLNWWAFFEQYCILYIRMGPRNLSGYGDQDTD
jgi:hypothetical protein